MRLLEALGSTVPYLHSSRAALHARCTMHNAQCLMYNSDQKPPGLPFPHLTLIRKCVPCMYSCYLFISDASPTHSPTASPTHCMPPLISEINLLKLNSTQLNALPFPVLSKSKLGGLHELSETCKSKKIGI